MPQGAGAFLCAVQTRRAGYELMTISDNTYDHTEELPVSENAILAALSIEDVRKRVTHIVNQMPSRLAGSENGARMAEYSCESLRSAGVDASVVSLPGLVSFPHGAECRVIEPAEIAIQANTLGHSVDTLQEGISGELVYVGPGALEHYEGKNVAGKVILTELSYSPARQEKQRIAALKGATAAIMMNWGYPDSTVLPFGSIKPAWGNPTLDNYRAEMPAIPCIGISRATGLKLRELCENNSTVKVWLRVHVENGWRQIQNTIGEISAAPCKDFIVVGGHQDSWYGPQATDNAAGSACIIELARVFAQHRQELRRGVIFGFWAGHETGTMIGSSAFVDRNWERLRRHQVAYMQIDQPGIIGTSIWDTHSNAELKRFHQAVEKRVLGDIPIEWHRAVKSGDASFLGLGVPMLYGAGRFTSEELKASAHASLGWWHHSIENTIDKLDWPWVNQHLRVYAAWLWELCTAPILPFEFVSAADQFERRLEELAPAGAAIELTRVVEQATDFKECASRLEQVANSWREQLAGSNIAHEGPAQLLNECFKRLSRILVPLQSTVRGVYGHDPYGLTAQTSMIPALFDVPKLRQFPEGSEVWWMLQTGLIRERNRVSDGLRDACVAIEETLRQLH